MKVLREYAIKKAAVGPQTLYITKGSEVVAVKYDEYSISLIVLCNAIERDTDLRTFRVVHSYETLFDDAIKYIGNCGTQHVVEII